jgi:uncharacterized RDD family membrane protein YckC
MQKADLTTRAVSGFVDLLIVIAFTRLPDVLGVLSATGYILARDGLFDGRSVGKKLIGLGVSIEALGSAATYRESIIRNMPFAAAYLLFFVPYAGWALGPLALGIEGLVALGDERGMRIGDLLALTCVVQRTGERASGGKQDISGETPSDPVAPERADKDINVI